MTDLIIRVRPVNPNDIPVNKEGVISLAEASAWPYVARLTNTLLYGEPSLNGKNIFQEEYNHLLLLRFESLFRLKLYDELNTEITNHLNLAAIASVKSGGTLYCNVNAFI
jgi:hypothetical protein